MTTKENDKLFCETGQKLGILTDNDIVNAFRQQAEDQAKSIEKPIGAYLFEEKIIDKEQIAQILKAQCESPNSSLPKAAIIQKLAKMCSDNPFLKAKGMLCLKIIALLIIAVFSLSTLSTLFAEKDKSQYDSNRTISCPAVKGLSLGMNIDEALKTVQQLCGKNADKTNPSLGLGMDEALQTANQIYGEGLAIRTDKDGYSIGSISKYDAMGLAALDDYICPIYIKADQQKKVTRITFNKPDPFFNSDDMGPEDFALSFSRAYSIPKLSSFEMRKVTEIHKVLGMGNLPKTEYQNGWEYSSDGWKVTIRTPKKEVTLQTIPTSGQRNFD